MIVITDIDRRIRMISLYPRTTGRNFYEIIRVIDTLQVCPSIDRYTFSCGKLMFENNSLSYCLNRF